VVSGEWVGQRCLKSFKRKSIKILNFTHSPKSVCSARANAAKKTDLKVDF